MCSVGACARAATSRKEIHEQVLLLSISGRDIGIVMAERKPVVSAQLFRRSGGSCLFWDCRSGALKQLVSRGSMRATSLFECSGTVGVHRDEAVTCTSDNCPRDLSMAMWFSLHSTFVRCSTALDTDDCPNCGFETPVEVEQVERNLTSIATGRSRSRSHLLASALRHQDSSRGARF
jgi:hypothetical protein